MALKKIKINLAAVGINIKHKEQSTRPNIDHLIKRISTERRKEQTINFVILPLVLTGIIVSLFFFIQF
jgi:hypothetical protein